MHRWDVCYLDTLLVGEKRKLTSICLYTNITRSKPIRSHHNHVYQALRQGYFLPFIKQCYQWEEWSSYGVLPWGLVCCLDLRCLVPSLRYMFMDIRCMFSHVSWFHLDAFVEMLWCLDGGFVGGSPYIGSDGDKDCHLILLLFSYRIWNAPPTLDGFQIVFVAICLTNLGAHVNILFITKVVIK